MPIFEAACPSESCPNFGRPVEHYYSRSTNDMMPCEVCGGPTRKMISGFNSPFCGLITSRYTDRSIKGHESLGEGHWAWKRKTVSGKAEAVFIDSWQSQRDFAKSEGLLNPREVGNNVQPREDGKGLANSVGMPGCEV